MSGMIDGVSKVWTLRIGRNALDIDGFKDSVEAIDRLVRIEMRRNSSAENKAKIRAAVEDALKHMDEPGEDASTDEVR